MRSRARGFRRRAEHWKLAGSVAEKVKVTTVLVVVPDGPEVIVVSGGIVSGGGSVSGGGAVSGGRVGTVMSVAPATIGASPEANRPRAATMRKEAATRGPHKRDIRSQTSQSSPCDTVATLKRRWRMPVQPPTIRQLSEVAESFGLVLSDEDLASFRGLIVPMLASYAEVERMVEPAPLAPKYPRTSGIPARRRRTTPGTPGTGAARSPGRPTGRWPASGWPSRTTCAWPASR